jgi:hypothetical protein
MKSASTNNLVVTAGHFALGLALVAALAGCGGVLVKPQGKLPPALVEKIPATVGVVVADDMRNLKHNESRAGVTWEADLGAGHTQFAEQLFSAAFREARQFRSLDEAKGSAAGLAAIFEPRIEQYSFATARETGGNYYAVTIRYRINAFSPMGEPVDSLTLTGYGNSLAGGLSGEKPLAAASIAAMRDAAAKFLVQFPDVTLAKPLRAGQPLTAAGSSAALAANATAADVIEAVPIN